VLLLYTSDRRLLVQYPSYKVEHIYATLILCARLEA
jgi:hypothetical protein